MSSRDVYKRQDVQWGNHDVQWMGAAAGSTVCVASVIHVTLSYNNWLLYTSRCV